MDSNRKNQKNFVKQNQSYYKIFLINLAHDNNLIMNSK